MRVHYKLGYEQCRSELGHLVNKGLKLTVRIQCIKGRYNHAHHEGWTADGVFVVWHTDDALCSSVCPHITSEGETA